MTNESNEVYQLKVNLKDVTQPIWRTIQVPTNYNFWELNCAIQDAMGWSNTSLHEFIMKDSDDTIYIIALPDDEMIYEALNPRQEILFDHLPVEGQSFEYMYDFDSGWEHEVTVEKIIESANNTEYPICLDGAGSCPPEGVGGAWEYDHALQVVTNPTHEDYDEVIEMFGGQKIDPDEFKTSEVSFEDPEAAWKKRF